MFFLVMMIPLRILQKKIDKNNVDDHEAMMFITFTPPSTYVEAVELFVIQVDFYLRLFIPAALYRQVSKPGMQGRAGGGSHALKLRKTARLNVVNKVRPPTI